MSRWSDGSDEACTSRTNRTNGRITGVLMLDDWWSLSLLLSSPLIGTLELAGTRRDSRELAGTRRDSQELAGTRREHWNSQELAGTRRNFGTLEHWYSAVAWLPGLADGRRRWQRETFFIFCWKTIKIHNGVECTSWRCMNPLQSQSLI